jgi:hypothetical protein
MKPQRISVVFWLDAALLLAFSALETVPFTGLAIHEWLAAGLIVLVLCHMLLSWTWIAASSKRLPSRGPARTKLNYFLNFALLLSVVTTMLSGFVVSEVVARALGFQSQAGNNHWRLIHNQASNFVVIFAAVHLAINWDWSIAAAKKCLNLRTAQS